MKCILHIGVHKTGSTSIQKALDGYDDGRIFYGALGDANHSIAFGTLFRSDHLRERWDRLGCSVSEKVELYDERLSAALDRDRQTVIFSGENISLLDTDGVRRMRERLEKSCDDIRIVMFVRDPLAWTASMVQEFVKHGRSCLGSARFPSFEERFNSFSSVFHRDAITVVRYEDARDRNGGVITRFCDLSGACPENLSSSKAFANPSISEAAFRVLLRFNGLNISLRTGPEFEAAHWRFVLGVSKLLADGDRLSPSAFAHLTNWNDYAFLEDRLGISYQRPEPPRESASADLNELDHTTLRKIAEFLVEHSLHYEWEQDPDAAIAALYHHFVARGLNKPRARGLRDQTARIDQPARRSQPVAKSSRPRPESRLAKLMAWLDCSIHEVLSRARWLPEPTRRRLAKAAEKRRQRRESEDQPYDRTV